MTPQPRYQPGARIGGRYQVHKALMGGMGEVYLCLDLEENYPFALKTFQQRYLTDAQRLRKAFEQEVATWVALEKHPNIVRCYTMETLDRQPFMVLEWIAGEEGRGTDLRGWLRRGPLELKLAVEIAIDICHGLRHAQAKRLGLVHRDLKPENILIAQGGLAKITDFGLAELAHRAGLSLDLPTTTDDGRHSLVGGQGIAGTPTYMAPEQWRGEALDERTDIYAIGVILYELLAGHPPFVVALSSTTPQSVQTWLQTLQHAHEHAQVALLPSVLPTVLNDLVQRCLAKTPAARYPILAELLTDLTNLYQAHFDQAPPPRPTLDAFTAGDYNNRGATYHALGDNAAALANFTHTLTLDPTLAQAYYNHAITLDPTLAQAYYNRGNTYRALQDYAAALADYTRAITLDPADAKAYTNRGNTYADLREDAAALADYSHAITLDPNYAQAYYNRGVTYADLREDAAALADYTQAITLDPNYAQAYYNRGVTYADLREYERALANYTHAITLDPTFAQAYVNIGALLANQSRLQESLPYFEQAAQLGDPQGAQYAAQVRQELSMELEPPSDPAQAAFVAFQQANSVVAMKQAAARFPLLIKPDFIATIEQTITQQVPPEHRPAFTQRLTWLRQIANTQRSSQ